MAMGIGLLNYLSVISIIDNIFLVKLELASLSYF